MRLISRFNSIISPVAIRSSISREMGAFRMLCHNCRWLPVDGPTFRGLAKRSVAPQIHAFPHRGRHTKGSSEERPFYGYAKKLELKNRVKAEGTSENELRPYVYQRTLSPEQSVLAVDLLRKHKATRRDAKRLRRMQRETPKKAERVTSFKPLPFPHCDPTTGRVVRSIVHQLKHEDPEENETEEMKIEASQLMQVPEEEKESVGSLEDLQLRHGTPRPPRPPQYTNPFDLPLSRPRLEAFHAVRPDTMSKLDLHFAEWFVGMTEAQQPFQFMPDGRPYFAVQHTCDKFCRKVRSMLHFGHVDDIKQIWYVKDDKNLQRVIFLLNGNLHLPESREAFRKWVEKYRELGVWQPQGFEIKDTCDWRPQLNNKWMMGWIDCSYGLFAGRLVETAEFPHFRIHLKFWLLSKNKALLEHLQTIFGGGEIEEDGEVYRWVVKERKHHIRINRYCRMFRPYSVKNVSLVRYDRLVNYPFVKVKTQKAWKKLQNLVDNLNTFERKGALSNPHHPYAQLYKLNAEAQMHLARTGAPVTEVKAFAVQQEQKDFPLWDTGKSVTLIEEVD